MIYSTFRVNLIVSFTFSLHMVRWQNFYCKVVMIIDLVEDSSATVYPSADNFISLVFHCGV